MIYRVGSLYAGVGGIDKGMSQAGFDIAWANEVDVYACQTYKLNHPSADLMEKDVYDIDLDMLSRVDVLTAGFPCQPFSLAGSREGFDDERGNHFYRIMEFVDALNPTVIFLENVKNFKSHDQGNTYKVVKKEIESRGYYTQEDILNTSEYTNIPQNRERFFLVAFNSRKLADSFSFPDQLPLKSTIHDFIEPKTVDERFYYTSDSFIYDRLVGEITKRDTVYQYRRTYVRENKSNMCPTLTANMGTGGHNVPLVLTDQGIRKLTPIECFRFQGFDDIKLPENMAVSHLYKQAGNSVTVPVIKRIARNIMNVLEEHCIDSIELQANQSGSANIMEASTK